MSFIKESINDNILESLERQVSKYEEAFQNILFSYNVALTEGVTDDLDPDLDTALEQLSKRLEAARRGLALTNKLPKGESRVLHRRKIMSNLGKIRYLFNTISRKLEQGGEENGGQQNQQQAQVPQQRQQPIPQQNQQQRPQ